MIPLMSEPLEDGGHSCGDCGGLLTHDNFKGNHEGSYFIVKGYTCPHCGFIWLNPKYGKKTASGKRPFMEIFDWRRIAAPARLSRNVTNVNPETNATGIYA